MTSLLRLAAFVLIAVLLAGAWAQVGGAPASTLAVIVAGLIALRIRDAGRIDALRQRVEALEAGAPRRAPEAGRPGDPVLLDPAGDGGPAEPPRRRPRPTLSWDDLPPPVLRAWAFVTGGNPLARVGLLVLFVGAGLGVRTYASTGLQLGLVGAVGAAMVALGWRLRGSTPGFGLTLQGGGVAVLYLTVYAAYALYGLVPSLAAIALMAAVAVACGGLALVQGAPGLAVLGVAGGFAAPVLAGTAEGNHVLLLSYYALLNAGVLGVAWARGWRSIAVVGFVSTFVTGGLWGGLAYAPALYATVQPFVVWSFAVYLALAVRFAVRSARRASPERALAVDGALVFGLPAATFVLQAGLVEGVVPFGRAWSAAALAAVYLVGAGLLRRRTGVRLLADAFLAIGLAFATLALPLAFERVVVGAMWVLEGAGLVWVGARQRKGWMEAAGVALQGGAAAVLFAEGVLWSSGSFSPESLTGWIVAVGLGLSASVSHHRVRVVSDDFRGIDGAPPDDDETFAWLLRWGVLDQLVRRALLVFALLWWTATVAVHVLDLAADRHVLAGLVGAAAGSAALFLGLGRALRWPGLMAAAFGLVPAGWVLWLISAVTDAGLGDGRGLAWLATLAVLAAAVRIGREHPLRPAAFVGSVWLAAAVGAWALGDAAGAATEGAWDVAAVGGVLAVAVLLAVRLPAHVASAGERARSVGGLAVAVSGWLVASWLSDGAAAPLPWAPVLNPLGLASVAALLALAAAALRASGARRRALAFALGGLGVGTLTAEVLRAVHAYGGVTYAPDALYASSAAQAALAVAWTVLALALAVAGDRRGSRGLWFFGAALLAVVVAKLFLVDLSQAEALVRIVAFVTVGALVLLVGWRAPLPPARAGEAPVDA